MPLMVRLAPSKQTTKHPRGFSLLFSAFTVSGAWVNEETVDYEGFLWDELFLFLTQTGEHLGSTNPGPIYTSTHTLIRILLHQF